MPTWRPWKAKLQKPQNQVWEKRRGSRLKKKLLDNRDYNNFAEKENLSNFSIKRYDNNFAEEEYLRPTMELSAQRRISVIAVRE